MINRTILVGRLTADPELKYLPDGTPVATFTLAVNRNFTNKNGEREADFIRCKVWKRPAENVANFLKKGSLAGVDGRIETRTWETDGKKNFATEVVAESVQFLEPKPSNQSNNQNSNQPPTQVDEDPFKNNGQPIDISDDDLPF